MKYGVIQSSSLQIDDDEVISKYANFALFPAAGNLKVIYIDESTNLLYQWNGSTYQNIGGSGASEQYVIVNVLPSVDNEALHIELEAYTTEDYSGTASATLNTSVTQTGTLAFDSTEWIEIPSTGLGTPHYNNPVKLPLDLTSEYFTRLRFLYKPASVWVPWTDWYAGVFPGQTKIPELSTTAKKNLTGGSSENAASLHKHSYIVYNNGNKSGSVTFNYARGNLHTATVSANITNITISNSDDGDILGCVLDNAGGYTVTINGTSIIGGGEIGSYLISLMNLNSSIILLNTKTEVV